MQCTSFIALHLQALRSISQEEVMATLTCKATSRQDLHIDVCDFSIIYQLNISRLMTHQKTAHQVSALQKN